MTGLSGGYPRRKKDFWARIPKFHYYKRYYRYHLLKTQQEGSLRSYAFLGETNMKDKIRRFDILEMPDPTALNAVMHFAFKKKLKEVRIQCAAHDPCLKIYKAYKFKERWETFILGKQLRCGTLKGATPKNWKHFHIDYI